MPSSPTDPQQEILGLYNDAFEAALQRDLPRAQPLLDRVDTILAAHPGMVGSEPVMAAWRRLQGLLAEQTVEVERAMSSARSGSKVARAYAGGARRRSGLRHTSTL